MDCAPSSPEGGHVGPQAFALATIAVQQQQQQQLQDQQQQTQQEQQQQQQLQQLQQHQQQCKKQKGQQGSVEQGVTLLPSSSTASTSSLGAQQERWHAGVYALVCVCTCVCMRLCVYRAIQGEN
jgi:type II secretory pathway pseudopilin PulG